MAYKVGIVGESNYQGAILGCRTGDRVTIAHEADNPYDEDALVVIAPSGSRIGYIARSHWLQELVHEEGQSCEATIGHIQTADNGLLAVVLDVVKAAGPVRTVRYAKR